MKWIFWPDEPATGVTLGGKALALWRLRDSGLRIPSWCAVLPSALAVADPAAERIRDWSERDSVADRDGVMEPMEWHEAAAAAVTTAVERLSVGGGLLAVRSSAEAEDGAIASFAGQYESFLGVRAEDVRSRVEAVWRSGFSPRVRAYRERHGLRGCGGVPTVLIQRMVEADVSGVVFGIDPMDDRYDGLVVAAVPGLGVGLVAGQSDAETWRLDRAGRVDSHHPAVVTEAWRTTADGVRCESVAQNEAATRPLLDVRQLAEIAAAALTAERCLGGPQDVEWVMAGGQLFIVQSRPITGRRRGAVADDGLAIWDNSNIVESYSGVTTPLTFSFARRAYEGVYREFCRLLAVPSARLAAHDHVFRSMLGLHRSRIYYNLLNWYRVLALLPGFQVNRPFMEQMMGVREPMPDAVLGELTSAGRASRWMDALFLVRSVVALVRHHLRMPATIRRFRHRLDHALRPPPTPWDTMTPTALAQEFLDLERQLLRRWDAPLLNDFFTMIWFGCLRKVTANWQGEGGRPLHNDLLSDVGGMVSAEPARRLATLARLAQQAGDRFSHLLSTGSAAEIETAATAHPEFRTERDGYLVAFGDRCFDELKLESPTLIDDPTPLYRAVGRMAAADARPAGFASANGDGTTGAHPRLEAESAMARALAGRPLRRYVFGWLLQRARSGVRERENLRLERTRLFGRVRRIFLALGHRLRQAGVLDAAEDIFYLEVDDVLRFLTGTTTSVRLREMAQVRQREFEANRQYPPLPNRFTTHGAPSENLPDESEAPTAAIDEGDERMGLGCCPGRVRGLVCLIRDPARAEVPPGSILVAERTDPGWIMLFPGAAGLLVERGSLLSHSAIVARELQLPTVVAVEGLTRWLRDGDIVEFDGATGRIRRLPAAPSSTPPPPASMLAPA